MAMNISLGSGATLSTFLVNGEHLQQIAPVTISNVVSLASINGIVNVNNSGLVSNATVATNLLDSILLGQYGGAAKGSLASGAFHPLQIDGSGYLMGLVSINGTPTMQLSGLISLASGTNVLVSNLVSVASITGSVAVNNFPATQAVTFNQLVSLASGTLLGLNPSANFIGLVSVASINGTVAISGTPNVAVTNSPVLGAGANYIGLVSAASITGTVSLIGALPAGTNYIGLVSISGAITTTTGAVTLYPGPNQIGSVTISSMVSINGTVALNTGANYIGLATITDSRPILGSGATLSGYVSTASGVPQLVVIGFDNGTRANQSGGNLLVNVQNFAVGQFSNQDGNAANTTSELGFSQDQVFNGATWDRARDVNSSNATTGIGLTGVGPLGWDSSASLFRRISVDPKGVQNALATVTPVPMATYTSIASIISATGAATLFVPPASQRWVLKDLIIGSLGRAEVQIQSEGRMMIPYIALATTGGYVSNFGETGLAAASINGAFVVNLNGAATISVTANVRFQST